MKLIDGIPDRKERLHEEHREGIIDIKELKRLTDELTAKEKAHTEQLNQVRLKMAENTLNEGYIKTFKLFDEKYRRALKNMERNRGEVYDLIHTMIDEITVYSRPMRESDKIAGRKKKGRQVPYRIHVKFKLPQDMLNRLGHQEATIIEKAPLSGDSSGQKDVFGAR